LLWIFFDDVGFVFRSGNVVVLGIGEEGGWNIGVHVVLWVGEVVVLWWWPVRLRWGGREVRVQDRNWEEEEEARSSAEKPEMKTKTKSQRVTRVVFG